MSAVIRSSIIMMHMPLSSLPLRPALPLICMYSPLDIHLQMFWSFFMALQIIIYIGLAPCWTFTAGVGGVVGTALQTLSQECGLSRPLSLM